jgi:hypothetical protein
MELRLENIYTILARFQRKRRGFYGSYSMVPERKESEENDEKTKHKLDAYRNSCHPWYIDSDGSGYT